MINYAKKTIFFISYLCYQRNLLLQYWNPCQWTPSKAEYCFLWPGSVSSAVASFLEESLYMCLSPNIGWRVFHFDVMAACKKDPELGWDRLLLGTRRFPTALCQPFLLWQTTCLHTTALPCLELGSHQALSTPPGHQVCWIQILKGNSSIIFLHKLRLCYISSRNYSDTSSILLTWSCSCREVVMVKPQRTLIPVKTQFWSIWRPRYLHKKTFSFHWI